ncbi:DUF2487 family protein [Paenibacillus sp. 1P07SE]|uniref:DUF2487 family protein n=1 Tax=Paenibacillus sp. 1P07SE TaxID=3132209 RepID=UPI0039A569FC
MKFSELTEAQWQENGMYYDTCLLPVTGLTGGGNPLETTTALEKLADAIDLIEQPFKGRVVIYPACHYWGAEDKPMLERLCSELKRSAGFKYVILVSAIHLPLPGTEQADLVVIPDQDGKLPPASEVREKVMQCWTRNNG